VSVSSISHTHLCVVSISYPKPCSEGDFLCVEATLVVWYLVEEDFGEEKFGADLAEPSGDLPIVVRVLNTVSMNNFFRLLRLSSCGIYMKVLDKSRINARDIDMYIYKLMNIYAILNIK
jgi:hypothetical protein